MIFLGLLPLVQTGDPGYELEWTPLLWERWHSSIGDRESASDRYRSLHRRKWILYTSAGICFLPIYAVSIYFGFWVTDARFVRVIGIVMVAISLVAMGTYVATIWKMQRAAVRSNEISQKLQAD